MPSRHHLILIHKTDLIFSTPDVSDTASRSDMALLRDVKVLNSDKLQKKLREQGLPALHSADLVSHALNDDAFGSFDVRFILTPPATASIMAEVLIIF